jgi:hypothetical protein
MLLLVILALLTFHPAHGSQVKVVNYDFTCTFREISGKSYANLEGTCSYVLNNGSTSKFIITLKVINFSEHTGFFGYLYTIVGVTITDCYVEYYTVNSNGEIASDQRLSDNIPVSVSLTSLTDEKNLTLTISEEENDKKFLISVFYFEGTLQQEINHGDVVSKSAASTFVNLDTETTDSKPVNGFNSLVLLPILAIYYLRKGKKVIRE